MKFNLIITNSKTDDGQNETIVSVFDGDTLFMSCTGKHEKKYVSEGAAIDGTRKALIGITIAIQAVVSELNEASNKIIEDIINGVVEVQS